MLKDKKILYLIKTMDLGGAEKFTLDLALYFQDYFKNVTIASSGGLFEELLTRNKILHYQITEDLKISNLLPVSREISKFVKKEGFDLVHTHHRLVQFALQIIPGKYIKNIYTSHNIFKDVYQKMIFPDAAIGISPTVTDNLVNTTLINKNKIENINLGVKLHNTTNCIVKDPIRFGYAGRLIEEKGIIILIKVCARLNNEGFKFSFIFRGKGEDKRIKDLLKVNNLQGVVQVFPPCTALDKIYSDFDVLIVPTVSNEGLPLSILEASARGKYVITSDAGAINDFIIDNVTGSLLKDTSEEEVYKKMRSVILKEVKINSIADAAMKKVREDFSFENTASKYMKLYSRILADTI